MSKWASTKGSSPVITMGSEIVPMLPLFSGYENRYLDSWEKFGFAAVQGAVAAQQSNFRLRNPSGSNVIAVVEKITISVGANDQPYIIVNAQAADLATLLTTAAFDTRGRAVSTLIASRTTTAGPPTAVQWQAAVATNIDVILSENQEFPLLPGEALSIFSNVVNQSLTVSVFWRERALEESERT